MRAIFGVAALDAGEIRWRGRPAGEAARRTFGYMPEERGLYPAMELFDQVEYFALLHGMDSQGRSEVSPAHRIDRLGLSGRDQHQGRRAPRTATSSGCNWPPRCCTTRNCSCSTSRSPGSILAASTT